MPTMQSEQRGLLDRSTGETLMPTAESEQSDLLARLDTLARRLKTLERRGMSR